MVAYKVHANELGRQIGRAAAAIREMAAEYESFAQLRATESGMGPVLIATVTLKEVVDKLEPEAREGALQCSMNLYSFFVHPLQVPCTTTSLIRVVGSEFVQNCLGAEPTNW